MTATRTTRAAPLPPNERRKAIIDSVRELVLTRGIAVTSREIAEAAQVAEGTIFKVFDSKDALIDAVIEAILDPTESERQLSDLDHEIDASRDGATEEFAQLLADAATIIQRRIATNWQLLSRVGPRQPKSFPDSPALVEIFEHHHDRIRLEPLDASRFFRSLIWSLSAPQLTSNPANAEHIVDLFLNGASS